MTVPVEHTEENEADEGDAGEHDDRHVDAPHGGDKLLRVGVTRSVQLPDAILHGPRDAGPVPEGYLAVHDILGPSDFLGDLIFSLSLLQPGLSDVYWPLDYDRCLVGRVSCCPPHLSPN